ncbi:hypothetical protein Poli38472_001133 [Pythium oligandrum]|uniref:Uncharacterized protein n=1 Tax=Pythium oligandrum TaxID=41045 RepID=A0A8K1CSC3_PYTOL|nr:hypothetical protein Poli38472_001133 [Pythium oligandrum]|eukprot:TMW68977.1 hypothetical protein Poli38472_001133 [Pythium oligandrum]
MDDKKTVLITGSTRGIGLAFADHYVKAGWNVIGGARNLGKADKLRAVDPYRIVQLDANDEESILRAAQDLAGESIDLLINNAGYGEFDNAKTATKAAMMRQFEVNAVGPLLITRAFLPHLRAAVALHGSAAVGQISSLMGSISENKSAHFCGFRASKAALNMINASLAVDLRQDQITALTLDPGYVATDGTGHAGPVRPPEAVAGLASVLANATLDDTGKFIDYKGKELPW